jgi:hypothetical protein
VTVDATPDSAATGGRRRLRASSPIAAFAGIALLVVGLGLWAVSRVIAGTEPHSYGDGVAPATVELARGHSYALAIRGGVPAERRSFVTPTTLRCTATSTSRGALRLVVRPELRSSKAINQIGTFTAPLSGRFAVRCAGLSDVFVDNAADAPGDAAGFVLVLAVIALAIGAPLTLSVVRRSVTRPREQEQIE